MIALWLLACTGAEPTVPDATPQVAAPETDCSTAKNTCPDYAPSWGAACGAGDRCLTFTNASTTETVKLAYQVGCDGDGKSGAPQCDCTDGPTLSPGTSATWTIVDGAYDSCLPSWKPPCLTAGLAVLANLGEATCAKGTRIEFTAGNARDLYNKFDSYNLDIEKTFFSVPVKFAPDLECAVDHENHDCRPLWCGDASCPDAYATPTTGGCADDRSPQASCQDTFGRGLGYTVTYYPDGCTAASCPSCQDATACSK